MRPADAGGRWQAVRGGAHLSGQRGDALVSLDQAEHDRRQAVGLGPLRDLTLLQVCMDLPAHMPLHLRDLTPREQDVLRRAPHGAVEHADDGTVVRLAASVMAVHAVLVRSGSLRPALRRLAAFSGVAQCIAVLPSASRNLPERLWEAQLQGAGVWVDDGSTVVEVLAPEVFTPRLIKPARWRFQEAAYAAWLDQAQQPV